MRSWVFRNRRRLELLLDRRGPPPPPTQPREPARAPRVVVLQPERRTR